MAERRAREPARSRARDPVPWRELQHNNFLQIFLNTMTITGDAPSAPSPGHRSFIGNVFSGRGGTISNHLIDTARPSDESDNVQRYTDQLNELVKDLQQNLPAVDENLTALFVAACESTILAKAARDAAVKVRDEATNDQQKADADAAVKAAESALAKAFDVNVAAARPILQSLHVLEESDLDGTLDIDTMKLMQCYFLTDGTPQSLGEFANRGPDQAALLDNLLSDTNLLRQVVLASGARGGKYGPAMQSYDAISQKSNDVAKYDILQRFALACSLELAVPLAEFDTPNIFVDPVRRYLHYERAYLGGDLDPSFVDRTTWECRMIGNCDATEEQLGWGRQMLRNYQPSQILQEDYTWRYCRSVRTEVGYRNPEWTDSPRTYQQIISGESICIPAILCISFIL